MNVGFVAGSWVSWEVLVWLKKKVKKKRALK